MHVKELRVRMANKRQVEGKKKVLLNMFQLRENGAPKHRLLERKGTRAKAKAKAKAKGHTPRASMDTKVATITTAAAATRRESRS